MEAGALIVGNDAVLTGHRRELARLAARHAVPTIYARREFAVARGLISYGSSITGAYRHVGIYAERSSKAQSRPIFPSRAH